MPVLPINARVPHAQAAIYDYEGCWSESIIASENFLRWAGFSTTHINAKYVNTSSLDSFQMILFPGGDMFQYSQQISNEGKAKITEFIKNGGGYFGICGGAYFASKEVI